MDNSITGTSRNLASFIADPDFEFIEADITEPMEVKGPVHLVLHFASLASPVQYLKYQVETLRAGSLATFHTLELARAKAARYMLA